MEIGKLRKEEILTGAAIFSRINRGKKDEMLQSRQSASCRDVKQYLLSHDARNLSTT
jgi:hypothetical protein